LTGDSSVQQPVTPRDPVVSLPKHQRGTSHTRTESGDADVSSSSQSQQVSRVPKIRSGIAETCRGLVAGPSLMCLSGTRR
jgi:hypothetical protein